MCVSVGVGSRGEEEKKRLTIKYSKIQQLAPPREGMGGERSQLLSLAWKEALDKSLGVCALNHRCSGKCVTAIMRGCGPGQSGFITLKYTVVLLIRTLPGW